MRLPRSVAAAIAVIAAAGLLTARPAPRPDGNWLLSAVTPIGESRLCILKVEHAGGDLKLSVVAAQPNSKVEVKDAKVSGRTVTFALTTTRTLKGVNGESRDFTTTATVVATLAEDGKSAVGSHGDERAVNRCRLVPTDLTEIAAKDILVRGPAAVAWNKTNAAQGFPPALMAEYQKEQDKDKKQELVKKLMAAQKEGQAKLPGIYREIIKEHADQPAAVDAAFGLIRAARAAKVEAAEAGELVALIAKGAAPYGPRYERSVLAPAAEALVAVKGLEGAALKAVEPVAAALTDADPAELRSGILTTYKTALERTGAKDKAREVEAKVDALEAVIDAEYVKTVPPFKPEKFAGRKDKAATRVAAMELFTGAQCPPCVAADVAFDALGKAYAPTDLILIQYHLHIPGPDPMTNRDSETRAKYYAVRGTPSTYFNGKTAAGGGGGMANAEAKYGAYTAVINPLLEESADVKVGGEAKRAGDAISIAVEVTGMKEPAETVKLRLVVVEETVKFVGGNRLRFHHQVVRAMPGGADGIAVAKLAGGKHTATVKLADLKAALTEYLDEYAAGTRPFPQPGRPMDLANLKVIALVQDDESKAILQAVQFDVAGK